MTSGDAARLDQTGPSTGASASGAITVEPVHTRAQLNEFMTLARHLYQGMPGYVAPLDIERRALLDPRKSPFFTHGYAQYWIARRQGRAVGRISAQIDHLDDTPAKRHIGTFGCLDAVDDGDVVAALLREAESWLRRRGRTVARGPFLLSINGEAGLMTEGHLRPPVTMLGWHPPYLERHVLAAGLARVMRLFCYEADIDLAAGRQLRAASGKGQHHELKLRNMRLDQLAEDAELGRQLFNDAWHANWGFTPVSPTDIQRSMAEFKPFLGAESGYFMEVKGELAAFALTLPNLFDLMIDIGPAPSPLGWAKLAYRVVKGRYSGYRLAIFGVASKYHNKMLGGRLAAAMIEEWRERMHTKGAKAVLAGWVLENNHRTIRGLLSTGLQNLRGYGVYEKTLVD